MLLAHAADLHIDSPLRGIARIQDADPELFRSATRRAFTGLIDQCLDRKVSLLLLAGDIFDGEWKDANSGVFLFRELARLREGGTRAVLIEGNHDAQGGVLRKLRFPENVRRLASDAPETICYDDIGVAVHGQSFAQQSVKQNLAAQYPAPIAGMLNVGLLHTNANGSPDHDPYAPCTVSELAAKGYAYWALGHIHARAQLHSDPWVVYPGNLQGRHARETGEKGFAITRVENLAVEEVSFVPIDVVRWEEAVVDASTVSVEADLMDQVAARLAEVRQRAPEADMVVRVRIVGASPIHGELVGRKDRILDAVRLRAADVGVFLEKVKVETTPRMRHGALPSALEELIAAEQEQLVGQGAGYEGFWEEMEQLRARLGGNLENLSGDVANWRGWVGELARGSAELLLSRLSEDEVGR